MRIAPAVDRSSIDDLCKEIVRKFRPERIILFGSHAGNAASESSDVDLLVVLSFEGSGVRKAAEILKEVNPGIPVDLVVRTPQDMQRRLEWNDFFLREIIEKGKVLYEAPHS